MHETFVSGPGASRGFVTCARGRRQVNIAVAMSSIWNGIFSDGRLIDVICEVCQTSEGFMEAEVDSANVKGTHLMVDGRLWTALVGQSWEDGTASASCLPPIS